MEAATIDFTTPLSIILLSLSITVLAEAINYFLVYSKSDYKNLISNVKAIAKKLEKMDETTTSASNKNSLKRKTQLQDRLKMLNTELTMKKFKSTFIVGIMMLVTIVTLNKKFSGMIVAKLPFEPWSLITKLSHRNIEGDDLTDCSFIFIYALSGIVFRNNIQKLFGFEPPQTMSPFDPNAKLA